MTTLLVMRHAKSDRTDEKLPDHERPLTKRGKRDAPRMGRLLRDEALLPDLILTSTATRAFETAQAVARSAGYTGEIVADDRLYLAGPDEYLDVLRHVPDTHHRVLVVGHNPGLQDLVERLTEKQVVLPTAALVLLDVPVRRWSDLDGEIRGQVLGVWFPRELP